MRKILIWTGLIMVVGGIGACDCETITFGQAIAQCLIGLPLFAVGTM